MKHPALVVLIALLVAQIATGSRLLHFCPASLSHAANAATDFLASLESHSHSHIHIGGGHHHSHGDHNDRHHRSHTRASDRSATAVAIVSKSSASRSYAPLRPLMADDASILSEQFAGFPDQSEPDRHDCAIMAAAKIASNTSPALVDLDPIEITDFFFLIGGARTWFAPTMTVACAQWPRPPTADPGGPTSRELLASLCRFLL